MRSTFQWQPCPTGEDTFQRLRWEFHTVEVKRWIAMLKNFKGIITDKICKAPGNLKNGAINTRVLASLVQNQAIMRLAGVASSKHIDNSAS